MGQNLKILRNKMSKWYKKEEIRRLAKNKYFYIGLIILIFGIFLNQVSSVWLRDHFEGKLPVLNDLILDNLPYYRIQWLYDLIPIAAIILFITYVYKFEIEKTPYFLLIFGISQIIRAAFICLTPFGSPILDVNSLKILDTTSFNYGLYPSGHTGSTFLTFLLAKKKGYKSIFFVLSLLVVTTLLLARGHYSIDIFSALIFAYALYSLGKNRFEKFKS
jgi:membrane-associated phospholipid phosphatase